jgi:hypothetical protein
MILNYLQLLNRNSYLAQCFSKIYRTSLYYPIRLGLIILSTGQLLGLLGLHASVKLPPAVVGGLSDLQGTADVGDGLALGQYLLSCFELADDLLRYVVSPL